MAPVPPSVDSLATTLDDGVLPRALLVEVARQAIEAAKADGHDRYEAEATKRAARIGAMRPGRVVNATGVLLHTNLGRARISAQAAEAERESGAGYSALEFDLTTGKRGGRGAYVKRLVATLTGAEDALVVGNNAGALFLTVAALGSRLSTVVSRGELIEIGGSFRLPDLMAATGSRLVEVGTTNRTRTGDYRSAIDGDTGLLLKVHPSNYRLEGFTEEASYKALAGLAEEHSIPFAADIGSGLLDARVPWLDGAPPTWLDGEPAARQTLGAGADLVLFSGDKLLGGPQAGIIAGKEAVVARLRRHPIARAVRIAGPQLAALAATLESYANGSANKLPFWAMASIPVEEITARSHHLVASAGIEAEVIAGTSLPGAGSVPGQGISTSVIRIPGHGEKTWSRLLKRDLPVVTRRDDQSLQLDLRTVDPEDEESVAAALAAECR